MNWKCLMFVLMAAASVLNMFLGTSLELIPIVSNGWVRWPVWLLIAAGCAFAAWLAMDKK